MLGLSDLASEDGRADTDAHVVLDLVVQHVHRFSCGDRKSIISDAVNVPKSLSSED